MHFMLNKLKNINFIFVKKPVFLEYVDIDELFVSNKASSSGENYKYFSGYQIRPLCIIRLLPVKKIIITFLVIKLYH